VAEPQRYDPEEKPDPNARKPSASKADWVVGAEEGLSSAGQKPGDSQPLEAPKLIRPVDPDEGKPREPKIREPIVVVGTLSRGYLDGQSRVAIFESTSK